DIVLHFALLYPERVSQIVLIEPGLLAPLADEYRRPDWDGWPYITRTLEQLLGAPIPPDKHHDLEYLVRLTIEIPIMYGRARGPAGDEGAVLRVSELAMPVRSGAEAAGELPLESPARIPHQTLVLAESNTASRTASQAVSDRLPRCQAATLPGGKLKHFTG